MHAQSIIVWIWTKIPQIWSCSPIETAKVCFWFSVACTSQWSFNRIISYVWENLPNPDTNRFNIVNIFIIAPDEICMDYYLRRELQLSKWNYFYGCFLRILVWMHNIHMLIHVDICIPMSVWEYLKNYLNDFSDKNNVTNFARHEIVS